MPFRWERESGPAPSLSAITSITVTAEYRKGDGSTQLSNAVLDRDVRAHRRHRRGTRPDAYEIARPDRRTDVRRRGHRRRAPVALFPLNSGFATILAVRITYLVCVIEAGTPFLRQRLRDRTPVRDLASRQRSTRVRGYL